MPYAKYLILTLLLFISSTLIIQAQKQKRALIIAVGAYDKAVTGWSEISSANDVKLIESSLLAQGFDQENIEKLTDEKATKNGILEALDKLESEISKGDIIVIHYSGHGQQIRDDNGDEVDGLDEAMVPIDAHARFRKGVYEGENHIRDDEIGKRLNKMREKAGKNGSVLLIMDSCHSGTASRGLAKARGTQEVFGEAAQSPKEGEAGDDTFGLNTAKPNPNLAPLVCFYGASAHELNYETKNENGEGVGSLSLAFSQAFTNAGNAQSYAELFDQVKNKMSTLAPRQTPQAEGNMEITVLSGGISGKPKYYSITKIWDETTISINAGQLSGINEGTEIAFYPLGEEIVADNVIAHGRVSFADAISADVIIEDGNSKGLENAKALVSKANYGKMKVSVQLATDNNELVTALKSEFEKYPLIKLQADAAELIIEDADESRGAEVVLSTTQEYSLASVDVSQTSEAAKRLSKNILAYAQANFLRQIEMQNEDLDVTFQFIPINATQAGRGRWKESERFEESAKEDAAGNINFKGGDFFKIRIINNGFEVAYISILDFQPDNVINVLVPGKYKKPADYVVKPGQEIELPDVFRFGPPYGTEVFKLIATKDPVDFRSVLIGKGQTRGEDAENNPFAELISSSFKKESGTRGSETLSVSPGGCNIYSRTFKISSPD